MSEPAKQVNSEQIARVRPDAGLDEILEIYWRDRAVIIEDLADAGTIRQIRKELEGPLNETSLSARDDDLLGRRTKRTGALIAAVPACRELVIQPLILALVQRIFGSDRGFQVNCTQAMAVQPGEVQQALHKDRGVWRSLPLPKDLECVVACIWAVENFTAASGATHVVPGSFDLPDASGRSRLPDGTSFEDLPTLQAEMSDGSVLVYSGSVYHGAGANRSDRPRVGMSLSYTHAALRQEENQYLCVPPEVARDLPEELQKLLGYELGDYALGFIGNDMQSPMTLLR